MSIDKCRSCGDLNGHASPIAAAECALAAAHRADLAGLAPNDRPLQVQLLDLYAHLRGVFPAPEAHRATRYVLELGWRPWVRSDANAAAGGLALWQDADEQPNTRSTLLVAASDSPPGAVGLGLVPPGPNPTDRDGAE